MLIEEPGQSRVNLDEGHDEDREEDEYHREIDGVLDSDSEAEERVSRDGVETSQDSREDEDVGKYPFHIVGVYGRGCPLPGY